MTRPFRIGLVVVVLGWCGASATTMAQRTTSSGVYTMAQAERGAGVFKSSCGGCHDPSQFTSASFTTSWSDRSLFALYDQIRTTMPEEDPGSLSAREYVDVIAYVLRLNSYPTGETDLPTSAAELENITFDSALAGRSRR